LTVRARTVFPLFPTGTLVVIQALDRLFRSVLKLLIVAAGVVLAVVLSAIGLAVALGLVAWQLLRGRPPEFRFRMKRNGAAWRTTPGRRAPPAGTDEVVDVEVREITDRK
jgi:hypothetical protein